MSFFESTSITHIKSTAQHENYQTNYAFGRTCHSKLWQSERGN